MKLKIDWKIYKPVGTKQRTLNLSRQGRVIRDIGNVLAYQTQNTRTPNVGFKQRRARRGAITVRVLLA